METFSTIIQNDTSIQSETNIDHKMMSRAIELAKKGVYTTHPNPNVGCVIAQSNMIVGEGFHYQAGHPHAEVYALKMAKDKAKKATVYVTLEPCSHHGLTPPCAEALIKAQVSKVICAMEDPNPKVSGRGIQMLRDGGIDVEVGLLQQEAESLNIGFIKKMKTGLPYVQLKLASSLDGQTALSNGESQWITSKEARQDVQKYRAKAGAILSTSQTVISDNASLNVRWSELPQSIQIAYPEDQLRQPLRILLDRQNNLDPDSKFYQASGDTLTISTQNKNENTETITIAADENGKFELTQLLAILATDYNINHLWVEAGATLANAFISQHLMSKNLVDELVIYLAPKLMGSDGRGLIGSLGLTSMEQTINLKINEIRQVGDDLCITATPKN